MTLCYMTPEPFMALELPIKKPGVPDAATNSSIELDLYDCLDSFVADEILDDDNKWLNEKTGNKETVKKNIKFWNFPEILIISLKRFNNSGRKVQKLVNFPIEKPGFTQICDWLQKERLCLQFIRYSESHRGDCRWPLFRLCQKC